MTAPFHCLRFSITPDFTELVIGPATSGRTRWFNPGYETALGGRRDPLRYAGTCVVFPGHLHRSAMMHFSHNGRRATQT